MGKPIVYCGECGESIREEDFEKGKAHLLEGQPFCTRCRPLPARATLPRKPPTTRIPHPSSPSRKTTTAHIPLVRPSQTTRRSSTGNRSRTLLAAGGGIGALVLLALIVAVASGGRNGPSENKDKVQKPIADLQAPKHPEARPQSPPPDEILRQLDAFSASSTDPDAVLQKCDEALANLRGKPHEARLREIEARARERKKAIDSDHKVTISIEEARKLQGSDPRFERKEEILRLLRAAAEIAGPRRPEVEKMISAYEAHVREAAARAAPPPPEEKPAPPENLSPEVVSFTLISADTDRPIPEFDPIPDGAVLNLAALPTRNLNIRANTRPDPVGCVQFALDGTATKLEKISPYALEEDTKGDYKPWTPPLGPHTLTATPFADSNGIRPKGKALSITFTVIDSPGEKTLYTEGFEKGAGKFTGGTVVEGGREGARALSIPPDGATLLDIPFAPVRTSTRLRFWVKPTVDLPRIEILSWVPKLRFNFRTFAKGLRKGEWSRVEVRLAEARKEYDGSGPAMLGETPSNVKIYFDDAPADARVLLDDFEILE